MLSTVPAPYIISYGKFVHVSGFHILFKTRTQEDDDCRGENVAKKGDTHTHTHTQMRISALQTFYKGTF